MQANPEQANPEQADLERAELRRVEQMQTEQAREPEWVRDHSKTWEQQAGQERTKAGDTRAVEHRHPAAAPPSAKDLTLIVRLEYLRVEPPADPCDEHPWA